MSWDDFKAEVARRAALGQSVTQIAQWAAQHARGYGTRDVRKALGK